MSKRIRVWKTFAAALGAALACAAGAGAAGARQKARPAAVNPKTAAVREATAEVLRETSQLRKLAVLRPVRSGVQSRAEIEQMIVRNLNESATPEEMAATEAALRKLGLVPADFQYRAFLVQLLTEQVAGYYDPKTQEFYLADWIDLDGFRPVMAHELVHALQDQHFNLRRFEDWPKHDSDAELAAHSLVEGDASFLMMQYVVQNPARQLAFLKSMMAGGAGASEKIEKAPRVLRESLLFPYLKGTSFVTQVYKRGGWEAVTAAYKSLPQSTEQVLHAEKYEAGEAPQKVALRDVSASLGKGWRMADHDVQGEWGLYLLLDEFLQEAEASRRATAGWGGDRFALFLGPAKTDVVVALKTAWDTEADAAEFFDAYARRTTRRYGVAPSEVSEGGRQLWQTKEGVVVVERRGASVVVAEGVPAGVDAKSLAGLL
jgi:Zn-dependent peptidase ImmA (M78 family)